MFLCTSTCCSEWCNEILLGWKLSLWQCVHLMYLTHPLGTQKPLVWSGMSQ